MADVFACNPQVALQLSGELATVRSQLDSLPGSPDGAAAGALASGRILDALRAFHDESSDFRDALGSALDRASGLLQALGEGEQSLDAALAQALDPPPDPAPQQNDTRGPTPYATGTVA
jgi:hypothetical protein